MAFKAVISFVKLTVVVSEVKLASIVNYVNLSAADILIDAYSINQWWLAD
jgi:hypothetical protein